MLVVDDVVLHPAGALVVPEARAVVVADLHVGYAEAARARGAALPGGEPVADRLAAVLADLSGESATREASWRVEHVVINGDVKHSRARLLDQARAVRQLHARLAGYEVTYVLGNHDGGLAELLPGARVVEAAKVGRYRVAHGHAATPRGPRILGHEHPVVTLRDEVGARIRARAFLRAADTWILPALSPWAAGVDAVAARRFSGPALRGVDPQRAEAFVLGEGEVLPFGRIGDLRRIGAL